MSLVHDLGAFSKALRDDDFEADAESSGSGAEVDSLATGMRASGSCQTRFRQPSMETHTPSYYSHSELWGTIDSIIAITAGTYTAIQ